MKNMHDTELRDLVDGLLLGDGSIEEGGRFSISQSGKHQPWIPILAEQLRAAGFFVVTSHSPERCVVIKGKRCKRQARQALRTHRSLFFKEQRIRWYPKGVKRVPADVSIKPMSLMAWLCGDGVCASGGYRVEFCTDSFTIKDVQYLMQRLVQEYGWSPSRTDRNRIRLCLQEDRDGLREVVKRYLPRCFDHKVSFKPRSQYFKLDTEKRQELRHLRLQGHSIDDLAEIFQMSRSGVYGALRVLGMTRERVRRRWQKKPKEAA